MIRPHDTTARHAGLARAAGNIAGGGWRCRLALEQLEPRELLAVVTMSPQDQLLLELVNRARANPAAEAARFGIDLNQNLPPGTISTASKQPLAPHQALVNAANNHSQDMLDNEFFDHTNLLGQSPSDRAQAAGYPVGVGENIAWAGSTAPIDQNAEVYSRHEGLFLSEDHRENMLLPGYREIGTGVRYGDFQGLNAIMVTENFGNRGGNLFITGVVHSDDVVVDNFYTIGEQIAGATVTATNNSSGQSFMTTTGTSGGYSIQVPTGTYTVSSVLPAQSLPETVTNVVVGTQNRKVDFVLEEAELAKVGLFTNRQWYLDTNDDEVWSGNGNGDVQFAYGIATDQAVTGDWNGDGNDQIGVFRNGTWYFDYNDNGRWDGVSAGDRVRMFGGAATDIGVVGDWNNDGIDDIGVFRTGTWYTDNNGNGSWDGTVLDGWYRYGNPGDLPVVGRWSDDGTDEIGVFRNGRWFLDENGDKLWSGSVIDGSHFLGTSGDRPISGDFNNDGLDEIGIYRSGTWFLDMNGSDAYEGGIDTVFRFGGGGYQPLVGNWSVPALPASAVAPSASSATQSGTLSYRPAAPVASGDVVSRREERLLPRTSFGAVSRHALTDRSSSQPTTTSTARRDVDESPLQRLLASRRLPRAADAVFAEW